MWTALCDTRKGSLHAWTSCAGEGSSKDGVRVMHGGDRYWDGSSCCLLSSGTTEGKINTCILKENNTKHTENLTQKEDNRNEGQKDQSTVGSL